MSNLLGHAGLRLEDGLQVVWTGVEEVETTLADYKPTLCLLWEQHGHMLRAMRPGSKAGLDDLKGYVWQAAKVAPGVKCIATYHPARIRMEWGLTGVSRFVLAKVAREALTTELVVPERFIRVLSPESGFDAYMVVAHLTAIRASKKPTATDIEGSCGMGPACIGFATSKDCAVVVPIYGVDGVSLWSEADEVMIVEAVVGLLEDPEVPKIIQHAAFELFVLAWTWGAVVTNLVDDTMVKAHELHCELEKSLEFLAMLYSSQPWWKLEHRQVEGRYVPFKDGRKATTEEWFVYNGTDCCVTYEVNQAMEAKLKPQQHAHYQWQVSLLTPLAYMSLRGLRFNSELAAKRLKETQHEIYSLQDQINREAASGRPALQQFYDALGLQPQPLLCPSMDAPANREAMGAARANTEMDGARSKSHANDQSGICNGDIAAKLIPLLTSAFCQARRTVKGEVTVTTWQPHRWNGKKWVRAGKRQEAPYCPPAFSPPEGSCDGLTFGETEPVEEARGTIWLKPVHTTKLANLPAQIETFEDVLSFSKDSCKAICRKSISLLSNGCHLSPGQRGELSTLLGIHCNVGSTAQGGDSQWFLYDLCLLPKQYIKEGNKNTTRLASDDLAIVKAWVQGGKSSETRDGRALTFLKLRRALTQTKFLVAKPDEDGRIRSSINLVATPTCRMAMYGSPTGTSDLNMQTIGKGLRDLFPADESSFIYQKDLEGSDAWGVAAYCAMLGDDTMYQDNKAKLKPAKILARIYEDGPRVNQFTREQLKVECAKVDGEGWLYFACKRVLHGSNYGMGKLTMANQILTDSYKLLGNPVWLEPAACERIQRNAFFVRYPGVQRWHQWMAKELKNSGVLVASTGFARRVFGRKDDHSTLKECLSHYPQYYTTYSIKCTLISPLGLPRQWTDPENRREDGSLIVEPLLLVHDSNVGQGRLTDVEFARRKLPEWFQNPVTIANLNLTIPASSTWGLDWKNQDNQL